MRKTVFAFLISLTMSQVMGQGNYYIYIESADHKPFYVRSGSKIFHSSGNGYLIMDHLSSASYELMIGFPDTPSSEWQFNCSVNDDDVAFILKNDNGKKVELNGLKNELKQSGKRVELKPEKLKPVVAKQATGIVSDDPFSSMLAEVVNDPTIRQQPVILPRPGDSLKLAKATITDSALLVTATPGTSKTGDNRYVADSMSTARTSPAPAESAYRETKSTLTKEASDSNAAIAKVPDMGSRKSAIEDNAPGKKNEDKTVAGRDSTLKDKMTADSASAKTIAFTEEQKHTGDIPVTKESVKEEKTAGNVKAEQKDPVPRQSATADKAVSSSEMINRAIEEAEKRKQAGPVIAPEKIVLGTSTSIKKTLQRKSNEGIELIYIDEMDDGTRDTIRILIPSNSF